MKKWFALILLIMAGLGAFIPCCAYDACAAEKLSNASASSQERDESEACSPFSSCTTCSGFTIMAPFVQLAPCIIPVAKHYPEQPAQKLPLGFSFFWQPPRVL